MSFKSFLMAMVLITGYQSQAKMWEIFDSNGDVQCVHENSGATEITDGPCFLLFFNSREFQCDLENGEQIEVIKEVLRIDNYTIKAFGHEYFGIKGSGLGIADKLKVQSTSPVQTGDPALLIFHSTDGGIPHSLEIHWQGDRAPDFEPISCYGV